MSVSVRNVFDELPPAVPAPLKGGRGGRRPHIAKACAPFFFEQAFNGGGSMSSADFVAAGVDAHAKAVGDALGRGEKGLGLHRDDEDRYPCCVENGVKFARAFTAGEVDALAKAAGCADAAELVKKIKTLPAF